MSEDPTNGSRRLLVGNNYHSVTFKDTVRIADGIEANVYTFNDSKTLILTIFTVKKGVKTSQKKVVSGQKIVTGFVKGKGTLAVYHEIGPEDTYYFENEGRNKEVTVEAGQEFCWTAPNDSELEYYEISEVPLPVQVPKKIVPVPVPEATKNIKPIVKLFLASRTLSAGQGAELAKLAGKPARDVSLALIENGADPEPKTPQWVLDNRAALQSCSFDIEIVNLKQYTHQPIELLQKLQHKDVIWIGGGNTFYLRWLMHTTRADEIITGLARKGTVYAGGSAGAIVAGPTLKFFETADDPAKAPEVIRNGLHLTEFVVVPHMDDTKYSDIITDINEKLQREGYKTVPLNNNQVLVVEADSKRVI